MLCLTQPGLAMSSCVARWLGVGLQAPAARAAAFAPLEAAPIASQIEIEPDTGVIVLYVKNAKLGDYDRVYFRPTLQGGPCTDLAGLISR